MDRNLLFRLVAGCLNTSLSARRAWIEIAGRSVEFHLFSVALRKESVDRNNGLKRSFPDVDLVALRKESVDRNFDAVQIVIIKVVALRKESVDRNLWWGVRKAVGSRRSPQGERG